MAAMNDRMRGRRVDHVLVDHAVHELGRFGAKDRADAIAYAFSAVPRISESKP